MWEANTTETVRKRSRGEAKEEEEVKDKARDVQNGSQEEFGGGDEAGSRVRVKRSCRIWKERYTTERTV